MEKKLDISKDTDILSIYRMFTDKNEYENIVEKKMKVKYKLLSILKEDKEFGKKFYTPEMIESIYQKKGINIDGEIFIKESIYDFRTSGIWEFKEMTDNYGKKAYRLDYNSNEADCW